MSCKKQGTNFSNAFATTPLCCPSRASIMTGRYAHNHVVSNNFGAWNFDESPTIQAYLHDEAGYRTGIFGKYLNDWDLKRNPAHWDRWGIFNSGYCPFRVNEDGTIKNYGIFNQPTIAAVRRLHDDLRARRGARLHRPGREPTTRSRGLLYLAPFAPHGPATPDDQYANTDVGTLATRRAVHDEGQPGNTADPLTDKPDWVQGAFDPGEPRGRDSQERAAVAEVRRRHGRHRAEPPGRTASRTRSSSSWATTASSGASTGLIDKSFRTRTRSTSRSSSATRR